MWTLNNFKPPCKTRAPRVSWSSYWFCGTSITFAVWMAARIFLSMGTWLQQHCLTTDRHLPCILFSISKQYSNIPCSKSHPEYKISNVSSFQPTSANVVCIEEEFATSPLFKAQKPGHPLYICTDFLLHAQIWQDFGSTTSSRLPWKTLYFVLDGMEESLVVKICHIWYSFGSKRSAKLEKRKINLSWTY